MHVEQPYFAIFDSGIAVDQGAAVDAQTLDFGAGERDAGFEFIEDMIVVVRPSIRGDRLDAGLVSHRSCAPSRSAIDLRHTLCPFCRAELRSPRRAGRVVRSRGPRR